MREDQRPFAHGAPMAEILRVAGDIFREYVHLDTDDPADQRTVLDLACARLSRYPPQVAQLPALEQTVRELDERRAKGETQ